MPEPVLDENNKRPAENVESQPKKKIARETNSRICEPIKNKVTGESRPALDNSPPYLPPAPALDATMQEVTGIDEATIPTLTGDAAIQFTVFPAAPSAEATIPTLTGDAAIQFTEPFAAPLTLFPTVPSAEQPKNKKQTKNEEQTKREESWVQKAAEVWGSVKLVRDMNELVAKTSWEKPMVAESDIAKALWKWKGTQCRYEGKKWAKKIVEELASVCESKRLHKLDQNGRLLAFKKGVLKLKHDSATTSPYPNAYYYNHIDWRNGNIEKDHATLHFDYEYKSWDPKNDEHHRELRRLMHQIFAVERGSTEKERAGKEEMQWFLMWASTGLFKEIVSEAIVIWREPGGDGKSFVCNILNAAFGRWSVDLENTKHMQIVPEPSEPNATLVDVLSSCIIIMREYREGDIWASSTMNTWTGDPIRA
ncbi:hypothetical protein HK097_011307 [Rhizophlyctis rosea]|uniref:Uncharacterized protein n=1 Tax=Rhizophlyctis rosea TaxID=64517 RepID=A0AAD5S9B9_9FUNG|nr:hypothetical protein HK097_011307 [Rhizophlyctis rosea]